MARTMAGTPRITNQQNIFINEYVKDMDGLRAAQVAGYSRPEIEYSKLLDGSRYPLVRRRIENIVRDRRLEESRSGEDVLKYIHNAIFFEPLKYFTPSPDGGWCISIDEMRELPPEIGCLIEELEHKVTVKKIIGQEGDEEIEEKWKIKFVSKSAMVSLAARHLLGDTLNVNHNMQQLPWDQLVSRPKEAVPIPPSSSPMQDKLLAMEKLANDVQATKTPVVPLDSQQKAPHQPTTYFPQESNGEIKMNGNGDH